jgi:Tfp pilus assembly protein PilX
MREIVLMNRNGNSMVVTMLLLVVLTAIGIYAVSISMTEMDITIQTKVGRSVFNAAEAGANFAMDQIPNVSTTGFTSTLPDQSSYAATSRTTGAITLMSGMGSNLCTADFEVTSQGQSPTAFVARRTVQVVVNYGPVPMGTMF